jgi:hypothetical protein
MVEIAAERAHLGPFITNNGKVKNVFKASTVNAT